MALVHSQSCESVHTGLDLFSLPPTQTSVQDGQWVEYHPLATLAPGAPIEFAISGSTSDYIDLKNSYLHVKANVRRADGTRPPGDAPAFAPVNYWMHSLFSQVDVLLNDVLVTPSENTYPYRAYIESTLNYGREAKETHLGSALYYQDTASHFDSLNPAHNVGFSKRQAHAAEGKTIDMTGRPHCDIFHQNRYILNGVDIKIRLIPSKNAFNLMSAADVYKSNILHASLFIRKVRLNPSVLLAQAKAMEVGSVKYPVKRVVVKNFSIPQGNLGAVQDNLFLSQTPNKLIIGLVNSSAFNGTAAENPFKFDQHGLSFISLYLDGKQVPSKPLQPVYATGEYARAYHNLMVTTGLTNQDAGSNISRSDFANGFTFYAIDLTPSLLDDVELFELVKAGALRMELKFSTPLPHSVTVVVWAEMDSIIEIDRTRQVLTDFSL